MSEKPWRRRLATALALLGILLGAQRLGWDRLTRGAGVAVDAQGSRLVLSLGWLLLLLAAVRPRSRRGTMRPARGGHGRDPTGWRAVGVGTGSRRAGRDSQANRSLQVSRWRLTSASPPVTTTSAGRGWPL